MILINRLKFSMSSLKNTEINKSHIDYSFFVSKIIDTVGLFWTSASANRLKTRCVNVKQMNVT